MNFDQLKTTLGEKEARENYAQALNFLSHVPDPIRSAVDLGANVGLYSLLLADRGAKVLAVEPNPWTYKTLVENIEGGGFRRSIFPIQCSADDEYRGLQPLRAIGVEMQTVSPWLSHYLAVIGFALSIPINDLLSPCRPLDFIKMDIEGMENVVLPAMNLEILHELGYMLLDYHDPTSRSFFEEGHNKFPAREYLEEQGFDRVAAPDGDDGIGGLYKNRRIS